jgi:hypothetical protein
MHHPVAHGPDRREDRLRFQPIEQEFCRSRQTSRIPPAREPHFFGPISDAKIRAGQTDPVDFPGQSPAKHSAHFVNRETDARRTPVDRQNAGWLGLHRLKFCAAGDFQGTQYARESVTEPKLL